MTKINALFYKTVIFHCTRPPTRTVTSNASFIFYIDRIFKFATAFMHDCVCACAWKSAFINAPIVLPFFTRLVFACIFRSFTVPRTFSLALSLSLSLSLSISLSLSLFVALRECLFSNAFLTRLHYLIAWTGEKRGVVEQGWDRAGGWYWRWWRDDHHFILWSVHKA